MRVVGFTILRNGLLMDYPFREAILSALPLCDRFIVAVGQSEDQTLEAIQALARTHPQIEVRQSQWDLTHRQGGMTLAVETNKVLHTLSAADWVLYLQADEVLHEEDYAAIRTAMQRALSDERVEGLLFDYVHFYGSYAWVGDSRRWYRREVRIIRPRPGIQAYRDAQGFRRQGRKLRVVPAQARIFHYGWVRPPEKQAQKLQHLHRYWHDDNWIENTLREGFTYELTQRLRPFEGTHPAVMRERIAAASWPFPYDPNRTKLPWKERWLLWIERHTGWRPAEFRNYRLLRKPYS
jgi:glycosyltransferase involved in cell wall biosynthesis